MEAKKLTSKFVKAVNVALTVSELLLPQFNVFLPFYFDGVPVASIDILFINISDYTPALGILFSDLSDPIEASKLRFVRAIFNRTGVPFVSLEGTESSSEMIEKIRDAFNKNRS